MSVPQLDDPALDASALDDMLLVDAGCTRARTWCHEPTAVLAERSAARVVQRATWGLVTVVD